MIVVFLDDVDEYVKRLGYDVLEAVANAIPDIIRREGVKMQVVFMVSDQAAADVVNKVAEGWVNAIPALEPAEEGVRGGHQRD
jgi:hypothetical protein